MRIVTISSKRQITLPAAMLSQLGIGPNTKVLIEEKEHNITLKPIKTSIVDQVAGSLSKFVPPSKRGRPFSEIMEETKRIVAKKLATKR